MPSLKGFENAQATKLVDLVTKQDCQIMTGEHRIVWTLFSFHNTWAVIN